MYPHKLAALRTVALCALQHDRSRVHPPPELHRPQANCRCRQSFVATGTCSFFTDLADACLPAGVKSLIMNALLPCVTFKGLVGITMSKEVIVYPIISAALIAYFLAFGSIYNKCVHSAFVRSCSHDSTHLSTSHFRARLLLTSGAPPAKSKPLAGWS